LYEISLFLKFLATLIVIKYFTLIRYEHTELVFQFALLRFADALPVEKLQKLGIWDEWVVMDGDICRCCRLTNISFLFCTVHLIPGKGRWHKGSWNWNEANVALVCSIEHIELDVCWTKGNKMASVSTGTRNQTKRLNYGTERVKLWSKLESGRQQLIC